MTKEHLRELETLAKESNNMTSLELLKHWNTSIEEIDKMNEDCKSFCKEIEFWLTDENFDRNRLSLLTSNLDCLLFERFLENEDYVRQLFNKASDFLLSKGINFLEEALIREGFTKV